MFQRGWNHQPVIWEDDYSQATCEFSGWKMDFSMDVCAKDSDIFHEPNMFWEICGDSVPSWWIQKMLASMTRKCLFWIEPFWDSFWTCTWASSRQLSSLTSSNHAWIAGKSTTETSVFPWVFHGFSLCFPIQISMSWRRTPSSRLSRTPRDRLKEILRSLSPGGNCLVFCNSKKSLWLRVSGDGRDSHGIWKSIGMIWV